MLNEDVHSAIDKKYDKNSEEGKDLHNKAAQAQFAEKEARKDRELGKPKTVKVDMGEFGTMDMPDDPDYDKKSYKYEMKEFNKECTKNKCGEHSTKSAQFPKSYKNVGTLGEPDAKELEQEKIARRAVGKRKVKMNKSESLEKEINNLKEAFNEIFEDIHKTIKRQEGLEKISKEKADELSHKANRAQDREFSQAVDRAVENDPEYRGRSAVYGTAFPYGIERKHSEQTSANRHSNKNTRGEEKTTERHFKGMDVPKSYGIISPSKDDWKTRKAVGKRKAKMNKSESLEKEINNLKEAVDNFNISEVSVGALARAAANNAGKRKKEEEEAVKGAKAEWDNYEKSSAKHPEDEPALYRKAEATDRAAAKAVDKAEHAEDVAKLNLPKNSKVNANKLFKAAQKVDAKREEEADKAVYDTKHDRKEAIGKIDRARKSMDYVIADPVKARTNEELMEEINSLKEVSDEIFEDITSQVDKKHGKMFGKDTSPKGVRLHQKVISNQVDELVGAAKRNLPDEEKNSTGAIDREANKIEARRSNTKNKVGEYKTDLHTIGYGGKLRSYSDLNKNREEDAKNDYKRATEKSIARHNKKSVKEELEILKEQFNSIFEVEEKEAPKEENKVKTVKKDKNGKEVELVSVEDELFPYDGTAKEQMQKKIIDKINDMIQGQATLQDLIHLVRQKKVSESFDEVMRMGVKVLEMLEPVDEISKEK